MRPRCGHGGDSRTCRASVIRDILRGRLAADPDPHGLRLRGARIVGRLDLENLTTDVRLDLADCLLEEGVVARDARLASIALAGCQVEHPAESPSDATRLTCSVFTLARARITGHAEGSAVNLRGARIGGNLECDGALLRHGTPAYTAQPYQQLAAGYRALGNDRQARRTLMAQRDDQLARTHPHWSERLWGRITKVTLGYGYQPWKALLFLAAVVVVSCVLAVVLGARGALAQTDETATPGRACTVVQQVSVGLDLNLPVGTSVARVDCDLTRDSASKTAACLSLVGWVLRLLAWLFAALFIAGFTSAVRKT